MQTLSCQRGLCPVNPPTFQVLLEIPQSQTDALRDVYRAGYLQGDSPAQDQLTRMVPVADSSSDEWHPAWAPDGRPAFLSERGKAGVYVQGPCQPEPVVTRRHIQSFAASPDGSQWAFVAPEPGRDEPSLFTMAAGTKPVPVPLGELIPRQVAYAPDGSLVFRTDDALYRVSQGLVSPLARGEFYDFALSPAGDKLVYVKPDDFEIGCHLRLRDLASGREHTLIHTWNEPDVYEWPVYQRPSFSPDGSRVLYGVTSMESWGAPLAFDLRVISVDGGPSSILADDVVAARPQP
ncbi:MAG: hypothetical protein AB1758_06410 [Candidatus Eremiobacterota bacterium]